MRHPERSFIVVTHYQRLLNYIVPDHVHVLSDGLLVRSGGRELALELEEKGYGWLPSGVEATGACDTLSLVQDGASRSGRRERPDRAPGRTRRDRAGG